MEGGWRAEEDVRTGHPRAHVVTVCCAVADGRGLMVQEPCTELTHGHNAHGVGLECGTYGIVSAVHPRAHVTVCCAVADGRGLMVQLPQRQRNHGHNAHGVGLDY